MNDQINIIEKFYINFFENLKRTKNWLNKPFTLTEKIVFNHLANSDNLCFARGKEYIELMPDRVAMQDTTAPMAILQFILTGKKQVAVPSTVHCDHLIQAKFGAGEDLQTALNENEEYYDFLKTASSKYGIGFWKPGAGIIHQVVLENYAFPGGLMIGSDSHTPNAGGLGMLAVGVGGSDVVDVMSGFPWEVKLPKIIGIKLIGALNGWASPKDIILYLTGLLTVKGGTGSVLEYFGEGTTTLSCTGKATVCNMGAEVGATSSVFPFDSKMFNYLSKTDRGEIADLAVKYSDLLKADDEVYLNPKDYYDEVIEIDLSAIEPHLNGPFSPDKAWPLSKIKEGIELNKFPNKISAVLIGSCTNSSYEDLDKVAGICQEAISNNISKKTEFIITPGSEKIRKTIERDGQLEVFNSFGGTVLANACGPCIGMWERMDNPTNKKNTILISFNRNFAKRNDGNPDTLAFIGSPEIVTALSLAGKLSFNPLTDALKNENGIEYKLTPPLGKELPDLEFENDKSGFFEPSKDGESVNLFIKSDSEKLAFLERFDEFKSSNYFNMPLLIKVKGKCTTDHISPAGKWLKLRGHLDLLSNNMLLGAENYFNGMIGKTKNIFSNENYKDVHQVAREYQKARISWVIVGEENYGEGSAREQAAMSPRHLGCKVVIVKSFARIHETNLKKQGILPLTFVDKNDYEKIKEFDKISISDIEKIVEGGKVEVELLHFDSTKESIFLNHSLNSKQIEWLKAGSALNTLKV